MSTPRKPRIPSGGKPLPPLTRLKQLSAPEREEVLGIINTKSGPDARGEIHERFGISLRWDAQLSEFRSWQLQQQRWDQLNNLSATWEKFDKQSNPGMTPEQIRERGIALVMAQSLMQGDDQTFRHFAIISQQESAGRTKARQKDRELEISERRIALLEKKAAQAEAAEKVIASADLTPEQRHARLREIFGMPA